MCEAGIQRLNPKLMIVLCTSLGLLPILFSSSSGAEIEKPLALTLIGGLITSTFFTLIILPCAYMIMQQYETKKEKSHID